LTLQTKNQEQILEFMRKIFEDESFEESDLNAILQFKTGTFFKRYLLAVEAGKDVEIQIIDQFEESGFRNMRTLLNLEPLYKDDICLEMAFIRACYEMNSNDTVLTICRRVEVFVESPGLVAFWKNRFSQLLPF